MSGVEPGDPVVLHRYQDGKTLCGGQWYPTGDSPCEVAEANHVEGLRSLPPCEQADSDVAARLLGIPKFSRCWTRDRASWEDPAIAAGQVQATVALMQAGLITKAQAAERIGA